MRTAILALAVLVGLVQNAGAQTNVGIEYYHLDNVGSVRVVTNETGAIVRRQEYFSFGEGAAGPVGQDPLGFTGQERDPETALDYFGARYYRPRNGRFTTVDPVMGTEVALFDPQRWNRYAYVRNSPLRYNDPDGRDFWDFLAGVGNALSSNVLIGAGRDSGNRDFASGQRVGDVLSLMLSAGETIAGGGVTAGGVVVCGTGVLCFAGAPAAAGGAALSLHGVSMGAAAGISLMSSEGGGESGSSSSGRAIRSLEKRIAEHREKLEQYRNNPDAFDNLGLLRKAPSEEIRQRIIEGRIRKLEGEIRTFEGQIEKLKR